MALTLSNIRDQIRRDLAIFDTNWVPDAEINKHINDAIDEAESEILNIYEDYFLDTMVIPLSSNQNLYSLPSNIYANKIRKVLYNDGSKKYIVRRLKQKEDTLNSQNEDDYRYFILNYGKIINVGTQVASYSSGTKTVTFSAEHRLENGNSVQFFRTGSSIGTDTVYSTPTNTTMVLTTGIGSITASDTCNRVGGNRIIFYPTPQETSVSNLRIYYIRQAQELLADADECDIPEFSSFVILSAKYRCLQKDVGNPRMQTAVIDLERERKKMVETLSNMVPDEDTTLQQDVSFYSDFYSNLLEY